MSASEGIISTRLASIGRIGGDNGERMQCWMRAVLVTVDLFTHINRGLEADQLLSEELSGNRVWARIRMKVDSLGLEPRVLQVLVP